MGMDGFKKYDSYLDIKVGDLVCQIGDAMPGWNAFDTCIVTHLADGNVTLARPHCRVSGIGTVYTALETFQAYLSTVVDRFYVYTTGASMKTDNRAM